MIAGSCIRVPGFRTSVSTLWVTLFASISVSLAAGGDMMGYFLPMPVYDRLESTGIWGAPGVVPREIHNGLEDSSCRKWSYWDGSIIKAKDGKYHMYASRWDQNLGHNGWPQSVAIHAVSDNITGPYVDKGPLYTHSNGKGHNVVAIELPDGLIAVFCSDIVPGWVFIASDPNGPFEFQGEVKIDLNGYTNATNLRTNMSICMREDSSFLIVSRDGFVMHSTSGIMGPYLVKTDKIWPMNLQGFNIRAWEDPCIWRVGKKYYCMVNNWSTKQAIYLTSDDGITNWKYVGKAYSPRDTNLFRYPNGTVNRWTKIERPGVYMENGHVTHIVFSVIDVEKEQDLGNDNHNSKIVIVPFDGAAFDGVTAVKPCPARGEPVRPISWIVDHPAKGTHNTFLIPRDSLDAAEPFTIGVYRIDGVLTSRISNASLAGDRIALNHGNLSLAQGVYFIVLQQGGRTASGRLTVR